MLGDLGADIIRVQNEEHSTLVNRPDYPYYFVWGRSKRSVSLDMKHPEALNAIRKLIENCDVLIENYSAGVLDSWGLDWETVKVEPAFGLHLYVWLWARWTLESCHFLCSDRTRHLRHYSSHQFR